VKEKKQQPKQKRYHPKGSPLALVSWLGLTGWHKGTDLLCCPTTVICQLTRSDGFGSSRYPKWTNGFVPVGLPRKAAREN